MPQKKRVLLGGAVLITVITIGFSAYWFEYLRMAHISFDNYYKFRGCTELLSKTEIDATCKLKDGQVIKLVQVKNKWFLDGDLGW